VTLLFAVRWLSAWPMPAHNSGHHPISAKRTPWRSKSPAKWDPVNSRRCNLRVEGDHSRRTLQGFTLARFDRVHRRHHGNLVVNPFGVGLDSATRSP
jgi:hypothetical protein